MSNEQLPNEEYVNNVWVSEHEALAFAEGRISNMKAAYRWFHLSSTPLIQYTLTSRVEKMIRLAVLEQQYNDMIGGLLILPCTLETMEREINQLREELK